MFRREFLKLLGLAGAAILTGQAQAATPGVPLFLDQVAAARDIVPKLLDNCFTQTPFFTVVGKKKKKRRGR